MQTTRIAAFSKGTTGGNPAGVMIRDRLPAAAEMQKLAAEIGYSETVFAEPDGENWRVRYFAPTGEVAFCGHATIALGVQLGKEYGTGSYKLNLVRTSITVSAENDGDNWSATLKSPETWSEPLDPGLTSRLLELFDLDADELDDRLPPTLGFAGNKHAILTLNSRARLADMQYDFDEMRKLMEARDLTTVSLLYLQSETEIISRNAFAIGGVVEDPATGAAAAALAGALVDLDWPALKGGGTFAIHQGEDMGAPSLLNVRVSGTKGAGVEVSGGARLIN